MADERDANATGKSDTDTDDVEARSQLDALKAEEERKALAQAREHQDSLAAGEENEASLGNLHYGDEARGEFLKDVGGTRGGDQSFAPGDGGQSANGAGGRSEGAPEARGLNPAESREASPAAARDIEPPAQDDDAQPRRGGPPAQGEENDAAARIALDAAPGAAPTAAGVSGGPVLTAAGRAPANDGVNNDEVAQAPVNDAPTDIQFSGDTVSENDAGAIVLSLNASDPDPDDAVVFSIADDPSGLFEIVGDQLKLKDGVALDYEAQNAYRVTVVATDESGATYQETVTINVADVNEAPSDLGLSNASVEGERARRGGRGSVADGSGCGGRA